MSQRKLNRHQTRRTEKNQHARAERANQQQRNLNAQSQSGDLSSEQKGLVICRYSQHFEVQALEGASQGQIHQCHARTNLGSIVVGDKVVWRAGVDHTGVIESRLERHSLLERPDNFGKLKPVAANIDQMLIVIAPEPEPQANLIDRYLVAAELMKIRPIIVLNKSDLLNADNQTTLDTLLQRYQQLDYQSIKISSEQGTDLSGLSTLIQQHTSIVVGQSGVGKSSIINALLPNAKLPVGGLSNNTGEGTHTTTQAKLLHLNDGGQLIDSPGIRDFSLWHINTAQLQQGYIDIAQFIGHCRFRNCQHQSEAGCAILQAVEQGQIDPARFASYQRTKQTIKAQHERGLGVSE